MFGECLVPLLYRAILSCRILQSLLSPLEDRMTGLTPPPDPGRLFGESVRLSFSLVGGGQGPLSGAFA